jgi:hypothetical protein
VIDVAGKTGDDMLHAAGYYATGLREWIRRGDAEMLPVCANPRYREAMAGASRIDFDADCAALYKTAMILKMAVGGPLTGQPF